MNTETLPTTKQGYYGPYGGQHVPDVLLSALEQLDQEFESAWNDPRFRREFERCLREIAGRPSELYFCRRLTEKLGGAKIYLKREDLNHTGAHKINNTLGQLLLAVRMGKKRVIAETGAGQHGVATATAAAIFGLDCDIYMGSEDIRRQKLNVFRMNLLGARVIPVPAGQGTLTEAIDMAFDDWVESVDYTHYVLGTAAGPHPFPKLVTKFQSCIGQETKNQILILEGRLPDVAIACVGGGSNAAGLFKPFENDLNVKLVGVEPGGRGLTLGQHAAPLCEGSPGTLHGMYSYLLQDDDGLPAPVHSISAGLDYPSVGPEHSLWKDNGRVRYTTASDQEALDALITLCRVEGIIPALESSHAVAEAIRIAPTMRPSEIIVVNLSGRGDKDCNEIQQILAAQGQNMQGT